MYKTANISVGVFWIVSLLLFMFTLPTENKAIVTTTFTFVGFSSLGIVVVGYAYCSEITFPVNEATAGGLFQFPLQIFGFIMTIILTDVVESFKTSNQGVFWSIIILVWCTWIGTLSAILMKPVRTKLREEIDEGIEEKNENIGLLEEDKQ